MEWWSIEVADSEFFSAASWKDSYGEALIESAVTHGAGEWAWVEVPWGVVLEVAFPEVDDWSRFRGLPAVQAALDAAPERFVYRGRGGNSGAPDRRRPRRPVGAGAAPLPESVEPIVVARDELVEPATSP